MQPLARAAKAGSDDPPQDESKPERHVLWRNDGPRAFARVEFDEHTVVTDWVPLRQVSVPERFSDKCEQLGLRRLRYARD